jgi:hypothetical protein
MRMRFNSGSFTSNFSTSLRATSVLTHYIDNFLALSIHANIDFKMPENNSKFGASISIGAM